MERPPRSPADAPERGLVQRRPDIAPEHAQRRQHREDERRHQRQGNREHDHPHVETNLLEERLGRDRVHGLQAGSGNGQARQPAGDPEHQALGDDLPDNPAARGAERRAHRQFLPAADEARDQQVGDVGAGQEQQQAHDHRQHRQHQPHVGASQRVAGGADADRPLAIRLGMRLGQRAADRRDLRVGVRDACGPRPAGPSAAIHGSVRDAVTGSVVSGSQTSISERLPSSMSGASTPTTSWGSPLTISCRPRMSGAEPKRVLHAWWLSTSTRGAPAASSRIESVRPSVVPRPHRPCTSPITRMLSTRSAVSPARSVDLGASPCGQPREGVGAVTIGGVVGQRDPRAIGSGARAAGENPSQTIRLLDRQRLQHQHVRHAEDDGVGADGEGQRDDRGPGVAGMADEQPHAEQRGL